MRPLRARSLLLAFAVVSGVVVLPAATAQAAGTVNATHVKTTATGKGSSWDAKGHPSPDPSGITYNSRTGNLIISDGEVEETNLSWHVWRGTNLYVASRAGVLLQTGLDTLTSASGSYSREPTGVGFRPAAAAFPERLFVSDDDQARIFEVDGGNGTYGDADDRWTSSSVSFLKVDAEDVAVNLDMTKNGQLLLVDGVGKRAFLYNPGPDRVFNGSGDFVERTINVGAMGAGDPEGIAYNASRNTIFVLDDPSNRLYEIGLDGTLLNRITLPFTMKSGAGLAFAPPSSSSSLVCGTSTSVACNVYIVDRGVDNDSSSSSFNDGRLYEIAVPGLTGTGTGTSTNTAPVADAGPTTYSAVAGTAVQLTGSVADDGLPNPPGAVTVSWSQVSGPTGSTVSFGNPSSASTTATFPTAGTYVVRLTASDGALNHADDATVTVTTAPPPGTGGTIEVPVRTSSDDAEQKGTSVAFTSGDLNLVTDGSTVQTVGMRFTGVGVPDGAVITNAYVQFQVDEVSTATTILTIEGQASDSAATFTTTAGDISTRPRTTTTASWTPVAWPTATARTADQRTTDLAAVVQEVVDRPGWTTGGPIALLVTGTGSRVAESFDGGAAKAPVLHIEYRTG